MHYLIPIDFQLPTKTFFLLTTKRTKNTKDVKNGVTKKLRDLRGLGGKKIVFLLTGGRRRSSVKERQEIYTKIIVIGQIGIFYGH